MSVATRLHDSGLLHASDEASALEVLHRMGCTDGLPVVVPTPERVERMVLALGDDADLSLGAMGPNLGACTIEKLAAAAVMAGCLPDYAPVVRAAALAILDPAFDLTEVQATTHPIAPLFIVNGPARKLCGPIASGTGALGPGHRANASIGRALRLAMINIGGGRPGISDMALLGHPGKFSFCLAEAEEASPLPPLHTSRGFEADQSAITAIGTDAPRTVASFMDASHPEAGAKLLELLGGALAGSGTNNALAGASNGPNGQVVVILNPEHAEMLHRQGYTRESIAKGIQERAVVSGALMNAMGVGSASIAPDAESPIFQSPEDILVVVSGGGGVYSVVLPSWCGGPHVNHAVSKEIVLDAACEVPGFSGEVSSEPAS